MVELENVYITLKDGRSLSARVWLPDDTDSTPVPAILEFLPYRKRDGTAARDESTYPVFARASVVTTTGNMARFAKTMNPLPYLHW